jgi:hypothetical protein
MPDSWNQRQPYASAKDAFERFLTPSDMPATL